MTHNFIDSDTLKKDTATIIGAVARAMLSDYTKSRDWSNGAATFFAGHLDANHKPNWPVFNPEMNIRSICFLLATEIMTPFCQNNAEHIDLISEAVGFFSEDTSFFQKSLTNYRVPLPGDEQKKVETLMKKRFNHPVTIKGNARSSNDDDRDFRGINQEIFDIVQKHRMSEDAFQDVMRCGLIDMIKSLDEIIRAQEFKPDAVQNDTEQTVYFIQSDTAKAPEQTPDFLTTKTVARKSGVR